MRHTWGLSFFPPCYLLSTQDIFIPPIRAPPLLPFSLLSDDDDPPRIKRKKTNQANQSVDRPIAHTHRQTKPAPRPAVPRSRTPTYKQSLWGALPLCLPRARPQTNKAHPLRSSAEHAAGVLVAVVVGEALEVGHLLLPRVQGRLHHRVHRRLRRELPVIVFFGGEGVCVCGEYKEGKGRQGKTRQGKAKLSVEARTGVCVCVWGAYEHQEKAEHSVETQKEKRERSGLTCRSCPRRWSGGGAGARTRAGSPWSAPSPSRSTRSRGAAVNGVYVWVCGYVWGLMGWGGGRGHIYNRGPTDKMMRCVCDNGQHTSVSYPPTLISSAPCAPQPRRCATLRSRRAFTMARASSLGVVFVFGGFRGGEGVVSVEGQGDR